MIQWFSDLLLQVWMRQINLNITHSACFLPWELPFWNKSDHNLQVFFFNQWWIVGWFGFLGFPKMSPGLLLTRIESQTTNLPFVDSCFLVEIHRGPVFRRVKLHHFLQLSTAPLSYGSKPFLPYLRFVEDYNQPVSTSVLKTPKKTHGLDTVSENFKRSMGCAKNWPATQTKR